MGDYAPNVALVMGVCRSLFKALRTGAFVKFYLRDLLAVI
jgi:hypothetical protein